MQGLSIGCDWRVVLRSPSREAARQREMEGCYLCEGQPRAVGSLCISCNRRVRVEPQLRELNPDGQSFKNRESR